MRSEINPFQNLYVTERASEDEFVHVVSPLLVHQTAKLFSPGNVVLQGTQGSGKTTLLTLLKPEIRNAYDRAGGQFPVPEAHRNYISAGINLTRSGILDFGKRPILDDIDKEEDNFALLFSDFINYYTCFELLSKIDLCIAGKCELQFINLNDANIEKFVNLIASEDCWFGTFSKAKTIQSILSIMKDRISTYRKFHQFNIDILPDNIQKTKTNIGEPISRLARNLKESEMLQEGVNVFIRIDQLEVLLECDEVRVGIGEKYRRMINTALSTRDPNVSYKIGTRTYAWNRELRLYRAETKLEEHRDYITVDVDKILRRQENASLSSYNEFAEDVFCRRLKYSNIINEKNVDAHKIFDEYLGQPEHRSDVAKRYCKNGTARESLKIPQEFSDDQVTFLENLFADDRLAAMLATAWLQQGNPPHYKSTPQLTPPYHWETNKYWAKERIRQALLQLAANCRQSLIWGGGEEIISLGAAGILCFLSICQNIWDVYLRIHREEGQTKNIKAAKCIIGLPVQNIGISSASSQWFSKIAELPGGYDRQRFIENIASFFREKLLNDVSMSYPGYTGFSLENSELEKDDEVALFLRDASDYGVLIELPHTSKSKDKKPRTKWYINPIYCPHLKIYEARIKEPYYTNISEVKNWIEETRANRRIKNRPVKQSVQLSLLPGVEDA